MEKQELLDIIENALIDSNCEVLGGEGDSLLILPPSGDNYIVRVSVSA